MLPSRSLIAQSCFLCQNHGAAEAIQLDALLLFAAAGLHPCSSVAVLLLRLRFSISSLRYGLLTT